MRREERGSMGGRDQQLRGQDTSPGNICVKKLAKFPDFTRYLPKKYFPDFFFKGGGCPMVSYTFEGREGEGKRVTEPHIG